MQIVVENLSKSYGGHAVLKGVSFQVEQGQILGLLGPNGAGKSTTLRILAGSLAADAGEVHLFGARLDPENARTRSRIGYLPEHNPLYPEMFVREYLRFVAQIHRIPSRKERIREVIALTGLEREQHKKIGQLSKGYRQRVGLAQAIIHDPDILILDEPTSGLDPNQLVEIRQLIKTLGAHKSLILSTHLMQEVEAVCDAVAILHGGRLVAYCPISEVNETYGVPDVEALFHHFTRPFARS